MKVMGVLFVLMLCGMAFWPSKKYVGPITQANRSIAALIVDDSGYQYDPADTSCDGYPRLKVETAPGTCLGMVLPKSRAKDVAANSGFVKPRTLKQVPGTHDFLVVDMGGWAENNGRLFLMSKGTNGRYGIKLLKNRLDQPHGFTLGPDGKYYLGEKNRISRFTYRNGVISDWQIIVGDLGKTQGYMHPLSQFVFDPRNGDMLINSGSPMDHCVAKGDAKSCPESDQFGAGMILRIPAFKLKEWKPGMNIIYEVTAKGLRNSMAMVVHPSGMLIQGENSRDFPELDEPYEEMNVLNLNTGMAPHFGWPYCYNNHAVSPEWLFPENRRLPVHRQFRLPADCSLVEPREVGEYQQPHTLMPPHVAPLHMDYYHGAMFPQFSGKLLMTWHGYQPTGHRLVAYDVDNQGVPLSVAPDNAKYNFDQKNGCPIKMPYKPAGGADKFSPHYEIISGWNAIRGIRPKGAPVGFTVAEDGSIFIVEDRENQVIVRLSHTNNDPRSACGAGAPPSNAIDPRIELLAWRAAVKANPVALQKYQALQTGLIEKHCLGCHGNMKTEDIAADRFARMDFMIKNDWLMPKNKNASKIYGAVAHLPAMTPMPPADKAQFFGTAEGNAIIRNAGEFVDSLPVEIEKTFTRIELGDGRKIRNAPNTTGTACGQFLAGDVVFVDPRAETRPRNEGWMWTKVYLVPGHSRLFQGRCQWPEDGVFWVALTKN